MTETALAYFIYSFGILFREGLEAMLVVVALATAARAMGSAERARDVYVGALVAVILSISLAWVVNYLITDQVTHTFEGGFQFLAAGTLFYVSSWLTARSQAQRWHAFIASQMEKSRRSSIPALAMGGAAFLAVFREGAETVVFMQSLLLGATESAEWNAVMLGALAGAAALIVAYGVLRRAAHMLPVHTFFGVTSVLLYALAVVFVGQGIAAWQEAEVIGTTFVNWAPEIDALGFYPTVQGIAAQSAMVAFALAAIFIPRERARRERISRTSQQQAA